MSRAADAYLQTRVSIFRANLLDDAGLRRLIELPAEEGLGRLIPGVLDPEHDQGIANPALVERALYDLLRLELGVLLRPLAGPARDFLSFWAHRFDILNLKAIIRGRLRGLPVEEISRNLFDMPPFTTLPLEQLLRTENVQELLRQLEAGRFADVAGPARRAFEESHDLLAVDATLDQRYYAGLHSRTQKLADYDRDEVQRLVGTLIDHLNLAWLVRYRFAYGLSPSETYYLLIPHGRSLHRERFLPMVEAPECHRILDHLPEGYGEVLCSADNPLHVENQLEDRMRRIAQAALATGQSALTRAFAYLVLREDYLRRVLAVVRGKYFRLDVELTREAVFGPPSQPGMTRT
jgi:V/A-type H+-transporting ATPase subunit C